MSMIVDGDFEGSEDTSVDDSGDEDAGSGFVENENRADAVKAVREAMQKVGEESAKEAKDVLDTPERRIAKKAGELEDFDPEKATIDLKTTLKNRDRIAQAKLRQREELEQSKEEVRRFQAEVQSEMQRFRAEQQQFNELRKDPVKAIRALGYDPEEFILSLAKADDPEVRRNQEQKQYREELEELKRFKQDLIAEVKQSQEEAQIQAQRQYRAEQVDKFVEISSNEEKHPHLAKLYKGREKALVFQGDMVAQQYYEATGGKVASLEDIAEYLEEQESLRYKELTGQQVRPVAKTAQTRQGVSVGRESGKSGSKTLNSSSASERRSLRDVVDVSDDERIENAKLAVRAALKSASDD